MGIEEFALGLIISLLGNAITSASGFASLPFLKQRKIKGRVEIATAEIVEPLVTFLANEGVDKRQQKLLFEVCTEELQPLTEDSKPLFSGSLDGQKIFEKLYKDKQLPHAIKEEGIENVYVLLCPRIATLLCRLPTSVLDWESNVWTENFSRLDAIASELKDLFIRLDSIDSQPSRNTSNVIATARRSLAQSVSMEVDLTGLRAESPIAAKMSDLFVHPEIVRYLENSREVAIEDSEGSVSFMIKKGLRAVVFGAAGAGKSTWTRWLQKELLTSKWPGLAIRVELRGLNPKALPSVYDVIRQAVSVHIEEVLTTEHIQKVIEKNHLSFLLDGFDELAPNSRAIVREWILGLSEVVGSCPIVVTSRQLITNHLSSLPQTWKSFDIDPFDEIRVVEYIRRWYKFMPLLSENNEIPEPERMANSLSRDPTIEPLTSNPLLLSTLLMVNHLDGSLPSGRVKLYQRYVEGMLGIWDTRRKVTASSIKLSQAEKKYILTELALSMQFAQVEQLDEEVAINVVKTALGEVQKNECPSEVLKALRERSSLIVGPGTYSFIHKSVSEFFVAESIVQGTYCDDKGQRIDRFGMFGKRGDDRWNVVIFLWAGLAPTSEVEAFIEQCAEVGDIELAYGIFFDQYTSFSSATKRRFILKLIDSKPKLPLVNRSWLCSWQSRPVIDEDRRLIIPDEKVRGLQSGGLADILRRAAHEGFLSWSDAKGVRGRMRKLIWISVANSPKNLSDWGNCIKSLPAGIKNQPNQEDWLIWLARQSVRLDFFNHTKKSEFTRLVMFNKTYPDFSGAITIFMIDSIFDLETHLKPSKLLDVLLDQLTISSWENIPKRLLLATKEWESMVNYSMHKLDLLEEAVSKLASWDDTPLVDHENLRQVKSRVFKLIKLRTSFSLDK